MVLSAVNINIISATIVLKCCLALGNVGSVSFRLGRFQDCRVAMNRALHIMIMEYGDDSKEVLLHRAKMLTFQVIRFSLIFVVVCMFFGISLI